MIARTPLRIPSSTKADVWQVAIRGTSYAGPSTSSQVAHGRKSLSLKLLLHQEGALLCLSHFAPTAFMQICGLQTTFSPMSMPTQTEAADVSKQLLSEPASASLSELPYPPGLTFGQLPISAAQAQAPSSQPPYVQFDGLVPNYHALAASDLNLASLGRPSTSAAAVPTGMPQSEGLSGTQQAVLAAQQAMATAQYSVPAPLSYPLTTSSSLPQPAGQDSLPLTLELQQAIAQSSGYAADAVPSSADLPLDPNRPVELQEDDAVSVETQDVNASPGSKRGRPRRSVRSKKRSREGGEPTSRKKPPTPITLAVTPVLAAITQAQPIQCLEGDNQECPGDTLSASRSCQP